MLETARETATCPKIKLLVGKIAGKLQMKQIKHRRKESRQEGPKKKKNIQHKIINVELEMSTNQREKYDKIQHKVINVPQYKKI